MYLPSSIGPDGHFVCSQHVTAVVLFRCNHHPLVLWLAFVPDGSHALYSTALPYRPPALQLPKHIDEQLVLAAISVEKDVDGFHPLNMGRLCMKASSRTDKDCKDTKVHGSIATDACKA